MNNELNNISDDLLVKYLLGETLPAEAENVEQWIGSNINNKKYYDELSMLWESSKSAGTKSTINADDAWSRFKTKAQRDAVSFSSNRSYKWLKIAALLILCAGGGTLWFLSQNNEVKTAKKADILSTVDKNETLVHNSKKIDSQQLNLKNETVIVNTEKEHFFPKKQTATPKAHFRSKYAVVKKSMPQSNPTPTKAVLCNNTPAPIEICITQTIKCNGQPSTISTCSTLQPDQEGKLHYKSHDKLGKHCTMSIDEITIKTLSTGQTIVLNANSKPATAQEFFKYITSNRKGDVVAGVLRDNCDENEDCGLKLDNNFGDLILQ